MERFQEQPDLSPTVDGSFWSAVGLEVEDGDQRHFGVGIEVSETVSNQVAKHEGYVDFVKVSQE